jgi:uncharacterized protein YecT (DUF1311 family)
MKKSILLCYITALMIGFATSCGAIDNPDAPDYVADFNKRSLKFETAIHVHARTTQDTLMAYAEYERFLNSELNSAYEALLTKLAASQMTMIQESQRNWVKYRDSEFGFIAENWTTKNFGSSAVLSRGAYRTTIVRERITLLLSYLKNY